MVYKWTFLTDELSYLQVNSSIRTLNFIDVGYRSKCLFTSHHILNFQILFFCLFVFFINNCINNKWKQLIYIWIRDIQNLDARDSPGGQWLEVHLPTQGTWVWSLVQEDSTHPRASKSMHTPSMEPSL